MVTDQRAVLRYSSIPADTMPQDASDPSPLSLPTADESTLVPADTQSAPAAQTTALYTFSIQKTSAGVWRTFFNDTAWAPPTSGTSALFSGFAQNASAGVLSTDEFVSLLSVDRKY
jgi:hypothetical protein